MKRIGSNEVLSATAHRLGVEAQFFSTPTSIFAAFGPQDDQRTVLLRVEPGQTDLGRLALADKVTLGVIRGELAAAQGSLELDKVAFSEPVYGPALTTFAFGVASAAAARFLGGGVLEILVAGAVGILTGFLALAAGRWTTLGRIIEPAAAFAAAAVATCFAILVAPISVFITVLAGLIVLVPGLTLTVAMTELATKHLASGTARLSSALLLFVTILFGVPLGASLVELGLGAPPGVSIGGLPFWTEFVELFVAPFFGALAVGVVSNGYALLRDRPAQILLVPGVLLLVPGSVGFRSVTAMLEREVVSGVEIAFTMVSIAIALVAGLLVANVVVPRRKTE